MCTMVERMDMNELDRFPAIDKALEILRTRLGVSGKEKVSHELSMSADSLLRQSDSQLHMDTSIVSIGLDEAPRICTPKPMASSKRPPEQPSLPPPSKPSLQALAKLYVDDWYPENSKSSYPQLNRGSPSTVNLSQEAPELLQHMVDNLQKKVTVESLRWAFHKLQSVAAKKARFEQRMNRIDRNIRSDEVFDREFSPSQRQQVVQRLGKAILASRYHALKVKKMYFLKLLSFCMSQ